VKDRDAAYKPEAVKARGVL